MKAVTIPGVVSFTVEVGTVLRGDVRTDAVVDTFRMADGSTKILIVGPRPYIEVTIPAKEAL